LLGERRIHVVDVWYLEHLFQHRRDHDALLNRVNEVIAPAPHQAGGAPEHDGIAEHFLY